MTSQITKDFKTKSRLRALADGGSPQRPPEPVIGTRSPLPPSRGDGGGLSREAVAAAMRHTPAPMPVPERTGIGALPADPLRNPRAILDARERAAGLRDGGHVSGPGGRTSDDVGPVMLSNKEYVLPADTADAIGRDKLDAIRLATHDFKDKRKESALRGGWYDDLGPMDHLADGGNPWIVDPDGTVRGAPRAPGTDVVARPNSFGDAAAASRSPTVVQPPIGQRPPIDITPPGSRTPPAAQVVDTVTDVTPKTALSRVGDFAKSALRGSLPVAGIAGAAQSFSDNNTGYREHFQNSLGVESPLGSVAADTARVLSNVGDAAFFGLPGRLGRGIAGAIGGEGFGKGFLSPSDRDQYLEQKAQTEVAQQKPSTTTAAPTNPSAPVLSDQAPAQLVPPGSYQSRRLSEMGVPLNVQNNPPVVDSVLKNTRDFLRTGGTSQYQNLGTYGGDANIYGRADDPSRPGRINNFVGVGATASPDNVIGNTVQGYSPLREAPAPTPRAPAYDANAENAINKRYDKLADELRSSFGPKGKGNLAAELVSLEQLRANELGRLRSDYTSRATAELNAATQARNEDVRANTSLANTNAQVGASAAAAARATAAKTAEERDKARQSAEAERVRRMEDNAKVFGDVADTFAAGDKELSSQYRELLSTLPPEMHQAASRLGAEDKRAFYTNIMREQLGRNEGLVFGRSKEATAQNAIGGALLGTMARGGSGTAGKAVDKVLSKIPKVGPVVSALRPAENLMRLGPLIGAGAGAYATPVVENYTRYDPLARDPETGAALPAKKDIREALKYGAISTYLNPFNDDVQTVSGRRTNKPTPDEEEASRRLRSALRSN